MGRYSGEDAHSVEDIFDTPAPGDPLPESLSSGPEVCFTVFPAPARWATRGTFGRYTWAQFVGRAHEPELWPGGGPVEVAAARLGGWTFARYRDDSRVAMRDATLAHEATAKRVIEVHGLVVEYEDEPTIDAAHIRRWWGAYTFVAYTTGFHEQELKDKPQGPRWRVLLPFAAPVELAQARQVGQWVRHPRHDVGIVAASSEDPVRFVELPAVAPAGYAWLAGVAELLSPERCLKELRAWAERDRVHSAQEALGGARMEEAIQSFLWRHERSERRPFFPLPGGPPKLPVVTDRALRFGTQMPAWPGLKGLIGGLWPGRSLGVVGVPGAGRTAFALQVAESVARAGRPVLVVCCRMGADEVVARLLALRVNGDDPSQPQGVATWALLQGAGGRPAVERACADMRRRYSTLYLWAPRSTDRTEEQLVAKIRAVSDAHGRQPPLVVLDSLEGWASAGAPGREGQRVLEHLRDLTHPGSVEPGWPGVATVVVAAVPEAHMALAQTPEALRQSWEQGLLAAEGALGPVGAESSVALLLSTEVGGEEPGVPRPGLVVVAKNREGGCGMVALVFEPVRGRFSEVRC